MQLDFIDKYSALNKQKKLQYIVAEKPTQQYL